MAIHFGMAIRHRREQQKKSLKDFAAALNESIVYVSDLELGDRPPPFGKKLQQIAEFLDIPENTILSLAKQERQCIEFSISDSNSPVAQVALALACYGEDLTEQQAQKIIKILNLK